LYNPSFMGSPDQSERDQSGSGTGRGGRRRRAQNIRREALNTLVVEEKRRELTPQSLTDQVAFILDRNQEYNSLIEDDSKRPETHYSYLRRFFGGFFEDRIKRSREIKSPEYQDVVNRFKKNILGDRPIFVIGCIDGRDIAVHKGLPADTVATYRVAGGDPEGFGRNKRRVYELNQRSNFYRELKHEMLASNSDVHGVYWGGAHVGCAAGEGKQASVGSANDGGLLLSMQERVRQIEATKRAIAVDGDLRGRTAIFMPHVFNVNNGHTYWGMERSQAIAEGTAQGGYTVDVLDRMATEGKIISSKQIVQDNQAVLNMFQGHMMKLDWENNYTETAKQFTSNVLLMKEKLMPIMESLVKNLYPSPEVPDVDLETTAGRKVLDQYVKEAELYRQEIEMRAVGLLQSTYAGFLNNLPHEANTFHFDLNQLKDWQEGEHYRYKKHTEEGIKASAGIYPPYNSEMFAVAVGEAGLADNVKIANDIVRKDRASGDVTDSEITDPKEFSHAPVPLVVKELAEGISDADWERYQDINFEDLIGEEWNDWTTAEHMVYLHEKGVEVPPMLITLIDNDGGPKNVGDTRFAELMTRFDIKLSPMAQALENLRQDMTRLYEDNKTRGLLIDNHILAIPALGDDKREPRMAVPYIKLGLPMGTTQFDAYEHV
jgi:hypothetical protein